MQIRLSDAERRATFDVLVSVAWADGALHRQELGVLEGARRLLGLGPSEMGGAVLAAPRTTLPESLAWMQPHARWFLYAAAAWMTLADGSCSPWEERTLVAIGGAALVPSAQARGLSMAARRVRLLATRGARARFEEELATLGRFVAEVQAPGPVCRSGGPDTIRSERERGVVVLEDGGAALSPLQPPSLCEGGAR